MNDDLKKYFDHIGMTGPASGQAEIALAVASDLFPSKLEAVFASEGQDATGNRTYTDLAIWSVDHFVIARSFLTDIRLEFYVRRNSVLKYTISSREFLPGKPSRTSRMTVQCDMIGGDAFILTATGPNCEYLYRLTKDILFPTMRWHDDEEKKEKAADG